MSHVTGIDSPRIRWCINHQNLKAASELKPARLSLCAMAPSQCAGTSCWSCCGTLPAICLGAETVAGDHEMNQEALGP